MTDKESYKTHKDLPAYSALYALHTHTQMENERDAAKYLTMLIPSKVLTINKMISILRGTVIIDSFFQHRYKC